MKTSRRGPFLASIAVVGLAVTATGIVTAPTTVRQGFNYTVSVQSLPRYIKAWDFLDRHFHYRLLATQITQGLRSDEERALAVYTWTRTHIRPTPRDWSVVDDHILHIIIRGHGVSDQMADVFTTLSTYGGVPAFWIVAKPKGHRGYLVVSFAKVEGRWVVFDVAHGFVFRDHQGRLAALETLVADPQLVRSVAGDFKAGGIAYEAYLTGAMPLEVPRPLRAELQMPWPRCWYEAKRLAGFVKEEAKGSDGSDATASQQVAWR